MNSSGAAPSLRGPTMQNFSPQFQATMNSLGNSVMSSVNQELGSPNAPGYTLSNAGSDLSNAGGIVSGIQQGGVSGYGSAAVDAGALAANHGAFNTNTGSVDSALGNAASVLGAYQGFKQGGVAGDISGIANVAKLGSSLGAFGGASGAVGAAAGDVAAPLALYNFAKNWQSGSTGSDALSGAEAGASIGSVIPVVGTLLGGVIGGAVGAISSAFGGGAADPETTTWNSYISQASKDPSLASQLNPQQAYTMLAGIMDAKNNSPGHSTNLELHFGRMGENNLMTAMTSQINSAINSGQIAKTATPQQIYSQVVEPWLQASGAYVPANQIVSSNGSRNNGSIDALLTQLIGQWQSGALTSSTHVGINGQTIGGMQAYGAAPTPGANANRVSPGAPSAVPFAGSATRRVMNF